MYLSLQDDSKHVCFIVSLLNVRSTTNHRFFLITLEVKDDIKNVCLIVSLLNVRSTTNHRFFLITLEVKDDSKHVRMLHCVFAKYAFNHQP